MHAPSVESGPASPVQRARAHPGLRQSDPVAATVSPNRTLTSIAEATALPRPSVRAVTVSNDAGRYRVQVELERGADRALGMAEGPHVASAGRRLVAEAALEALTLLGVGAERSAIDTVTISAIGSHSVAIVSVVMDAGSHEEIHVGSALVRASGEHDALARAFLDATNRRLGGRA